MNEKLFTPIRIGNVDIKNRVIQPFMCVYFNADTVTSTGFFQKLCVQ
ncbi:MAG: hypothetical protein LUE65_13195 [Clostridiales bacterium]|nr:hypothetical protein [Clostridiales bacterium]